MKSADLIIVGQQAEDLKRRTMAFALDVCALLKRFPGDEPGPTVKRQLARSATSVAINYRAACRARSHLEFTSRLSVVAEEADESLGWLEFTRAATLANTAELDRLVQESTELTAIFSASVGTARHRHSRRRGSQANANAEP